MDLGKESLTERSDTRKAHVAPAAFTVAEFCEAHRISRALFYLLLRENNGPRLLKAGRRTLVTVDAAAEWRQKMEAASAGGAA